MLLPAPGGRDALHVSAGLPLLSQSPVGCSPWPADQGPTEGLQMGGKEFLGLPAHPRIMSRARLPEITGQL